MGVTNWFSVSWFNLAPKRRLGIKFRRHAYGHTAQLLAAYLYQGTAWDTEAVHTASGFGV